MCNTSEQKLTNKNWSPSSLLYPIIFRIYFVGSRITYQNMEPIANLMEILRMLYKKIDCLKYFTTVEQSNRLKISELKMSSVLQQNYVFSVIQPNNEYSNCLSTALIFKRNGKQFNTLELIESFSCSLLPNMENFVPYTHSLCGGFVLELLLMCIIRMFSFPNREQNDRTDISIQTCTHKRELWTPKMSNRTTNIS